MVMENYNSSFEVEEETVDILQNMDTTEDLTGVSTNRKRNAISEFISKSEIVYQYYVTRPNDKDFFQWTVAKTPNGRYAVSQENREPTIYFLFDIGRIQTHIKSVATALPLPEEESVTKVKVDKIGIGDPIDS